MAKMFRLISAFVLAAICIAGTAEAQVLLSPNGIQRAQPQIRDQADSSQQVDPANVPELARAEINRLRTSNRELRQAFSQTLSALQELRRQLDETARRGGSLVTAYCESETVSRNTAGDTEDCSTSGYTCGSVNGLCHRQCSSSSMCAGGFTCDIPAGRCIVPTPSNDDGSGW